MITKQKRLLFPLPASHRHPRGGEQVGEDYPRGKSLPDQPAAALPQSEGDGLGPAAGMWWEMLGLRVSGGGWDEPGSARIAAQGGPGSTPAANGGVLRHPGQGGSRARGARPENKGLHLFLPSFHPQPLAASPHWIVPAFSLLQLFTGSPWCRHAHKERAIRRGCLCATGTASPSPAPRSTVVALNQAGRVPEPALLSGSGGPGASRAPWAYSSAQAGAVGFWGGGPKKSGLDGFAHASIVPPLMAGK